jgi:hypothetical protein
VRTNFALLEDGPEPPAIDRDRLKSLVCPGLTGDASYRVQEVDVEGQLLAVPAPNAIEWCTGAEWADSPSLYEYYRSYQTIRDYFELRCPICNEGGTEDGQPGDCWGKPRSYLESEVLLVWDNDNLEDTCPKCGTTRSEFTEDGLFHGFNQMHLVIGMRAGKSMTAGLIGTYAEHRFLTLAHGQPGGIHGYLDITPAEIFEITFLASNQIQGETTIWAKYTGFRRNAPWFKRYVPWIKRKEKEQAKTGMKPWRYNEGTKTIINEHPNVRLIINSLNSNSAGQAGRTRVHGFVDELARMKQTEGALGAEEVYRTIEASLRTIRSRVRLYGGLPWFGSMVSVTSPISRDDKAMQLLRIASEIDDMYARRYPTWEFNPKEPRSGFESEFKKDPIGAERDFGANPPGAEHPLIHDENRWFNLTIDRDLEPQSFFEYYERMDPTGQEYMAVRLKHSERMFDKRMPRYITWDAGKNFDSFAGCCGHGERVMGEDEDGKEIEILVTVYDWFVRILPIVGTEVYFDSVRDLMKGLKPFMYCAFCSFDRWNSVQLIQNIRDLGIPAEQQTLSDKDFIDWKIDCFSGKVRMLPPAGGDIKMDKSGEDYKRPLEWIVDPPYLQPESNVIYELLGLQQDPDTNKVFNPLKGVERGWNSDDCARVAVHTHKLVQHAGFNAKYDDRSKRGARRKAEHGSAQWGSRGTVVSPPSAGIRNWQGGRGW